MSDHGHMTVSASGLSGAGSWWTDLRWLVTADPERVLGLPASDADSDARLVAAVYQASVDVHRDVPPWVRRQLLALDAARYGDRELSARIAAVPVEDVDAEPWRVLWSTGTQRDPNFQMNPSGHTSGVNAVATTFSDGRHVVVTGSKDQTVQVRDLETGRPVGGPMGDLNGRVWAVATAVVDGRPYVVTASDWAVRAWDLATRHQTGELPGINGEVWCVGMAVVRGRPCALASDDDVSVRVWDLAGGEQVGELTGHDDFLMAVETLVIDGRPHAVGCMSRGKVWTWDLTTGQPVGEPLPGHDSEAWAVATAVIGGRAHAITAGYDATVRVWDLATRREVGRLVGHEGTVSAVVTAVIGGELRVVTGGSDGTVCLWEPAAGRQIGRELVFPAPVYALTVTPEGSLVVGFGGDVAVLTLHSDPGSTRP
ncbi:WD40 repeat domain-containing protein [Streptomyces sp. NPDC088766]|uniref:WD40 repeat domain-containing protein n=1 Tax=Streptomyces sp. NPDC088766 TaxID=3365893 RepID=UPI003803EABE